MWIGDDLVLASAASSVPDSTEILARRLSGITMTMFASSFSFFAFTLPVSLYLVIRRRTPEDEVRRNFAYYIMWTLLYLSQYVNNAAGFFWCLVGGMFRRELVKMMQNIMPKRLQLSIADRRRQQSRASADKAVVLIGQRVTSASQRNSHQPVTSNCNIEMDTQNHVNNHSFEPPVTIDEASLINQCSDLSNNHHEEKYRSRRDHHKKAYNWAADSEVFNFFLIKFF